jgi:uncharacterized repeat protein (TIGR03803 family)
MKALVNQVYALAILVLVAPLVGCGGTNMTPSPQTASVASKAGSQGYKILYSFRGHDGANPLASLVNVDGTLYGTTSQGGAHNGGTVFSITPSGEEHVLYSFQDSDAAGYYPGAALLDMNGTLYGTTELGGKTNGSVFSITSGGHLHALYGFGSGGPSGMQPLASLITAKGILYGTTGFGGYGNFGTAFSMSTSGEETTLHGFGHPYKTDGQHPAAAVTELNGVFYGTTLEGGKYGRGNSCAGSPCPGDGTIFSITPNGKERVLHSFGSGFDGINPQAALAVVEGKLYGVTDLGGTSNAGVIFSLTTAGMEKTLYSFKGGSDGAIPEAGLIEVNGRLYGTTLGAGAYGPYGTIFKINPDGSGKVVLHSFGSSGDGSAPMASLLNVKGTLYGTTSSGGAYGKGMVFALPL